MTDWRFLYRARYHDNHDGDTVTMVLDLGLEVHVFRPIRVAGLWCPEMTEPAGQNAAADAFEWFVSREVAGGPWPFVVELHKTRTGRERRSFSRYVGDIYDQDLESFADWMVESGHGTRERAS